VHCKERAVHVPVTKQEVKKAINSLNRNKAADFYGITAENIVYGGDNLVKYIQEVLNKCDFLPSSIWSSVLCA
jgi:hypothetical protein